MLLATAPDTAAAAAEEALGLFRRAAELAPADPKFGEAVRMMEAGVEQYRQQQSANAQRAFARDQKAAEDAEDAAYDADEDSFADQRVY